jgi:Ca2+-binding RTX toxin-like protein
MTEFSAVLELSKLTHSQGIKLKGIGWPALSSGGDFNGDGIGDLAVGQVGGGQTYVLFGHHGNFAASIDLGTLDGTNGFQLAGVSAGDLSGCSVSLAGDVNGDGFDDIIIGARYADPNGISNAGQTYVVFGHAGPFPATFNLADLDGTNGFSINGDFDSDFSGAAVSVAGDINGDGFSDIIIGAPNAYRNGQIAHGGSYVVFGSGAGFGADVDLGALDGSDGFFLEFTDYFGEQGLAVSTAGDINGDGFDDLMVSGRTASFLLFGKAGGFDATVDLAALDGSDGFRMQGNLSLATAGDVNADGFADFIVGSQGDEKSYLVFGASSGFAPTLDLTNLGSEGSRFLSAGYAVSSAGDVNGDGFDDLLVGSPHSPIDGKYDAGFAYVIFGGRSLPATIRPSDLDGDNGFVIKGIHAFDRIGISLTSADLNADGFSDIVIGSFNDPSYVIYGHRADTAVTRVGTALSNTINGGRGNDSLSGLGGRDTLIGWEGSDLIRGGSGADVIRGGTGNDVIDGGTGADKMNGESGIDTLSYLYSIGGVTINLATNTASGGDAAGDTFSKVENIIGSELADTLAGNSVANQIEGSGGADTLDGAGGRDTLSYALSGTGVVVDLATSVASGGDANGDAISNFENILGSASSDSLTGDGNDNRIEGGRGADTLTGAGGADTLSYFSSQAGVTVNLLTGDVSGGDAQGDIISGFENIQGSALADRLKGTSLANGISGLAGDDLIEGGGAGDKLAGGEGVDTLSYRTSSGGVTVNIATNNADGGNAAGDVISGFENILGSALSDSLAGNASANIIEGGAGGDTLAGAAGSDTLSYAHSGSGVSIDLATRLTTGGDAAGDVISDFENMIGSKFGDRLIGNSQANVILGGNGNDWISGGGGGDNLAGGLGLDTVSYLGSSKGVVVNLTTNTASGGHADGDLISGFENIQGSELSDILTGSTAANRIAGGAGGDMIEGGNGADALIGGGGIDTLSYDTSRAGVSIDLGSNLANGGDAAGDKISGFENIIGSAFSDTLKGGSSANFLEGGKGADILDGRGGIDTISYEHSKFGVTVNLKTGLGGPGALGNSGDAVGDIITNVEHVIGSRWNDGIFGDNGDNTIEGGKGSDTLRGGNGNDTLSYAHSTKGVSVMLFGYKVWGGDASGDIISEFENLIGSDFNDFLSAAFYGSTLDGRLGDDRFQMSGFSDTIYGGAGMDTLDYSTSEEAVSVNLSTKSAHGGDAEGDIFTSIENVIGSDYGSNLVGSAVANILTGGSRIDYLEGRGGDDKLAGKDGTDVLDGGAGADILLGGAGDDTATYAHSSGGVTVDLAKEAGHGGDAEGDILLKIENVSGSRFQDDISGNGASNNLDGGAGNDDLDGASGDDVLMGEEGSDTLVGGAGFDQLHGGAGNDRLSGGLGSDLLTGDVGRDVFVFAKAGESPPSEADAIADFVHGTDLIDLSSIDARSGTPSDDDFAFGGYKAGLIANGITISESGSYTLIRIDVNGDTNAAEMIIALKGVGIGLTASDFEL